MKFSKDGIVSFDDKWFSYQNVQTGSRLISTSKIIKDNCTPFDADYFAEKTAKKEGVEKQVILDRWKAKGKLTSEIGTYIHSVFETYHLTGEVVKTSSHKKEDSAIQFIKDYFLSEKLRVIDCEGIYYNDKIATRIDYIVENQKGENYIFDFKTNDVISQNSYGKNMLNEFSIVPDCDYYKYSVQLGLNERLYGDIDGSYIIQITDEKYDFIKPVDILRSVNLTKYGL